MSNYLPNSFNVLMKAVASESQRLSYTSGAEDLVVGQIILQQDTGDIFMWDGTNWNNIGTEKITNQILIDDSDISYSLQLVDSNRYFLCQNPDHDQTIVINSGNNFYEGMIVYFEQQIAEHPVTIVAGAGMTLRTSEATLPQTAGQYSTITIRFTSTTEFIVLGEKATA